MNVSSSIGNTVEDSKVRLGLWTNWSFGSIRGVTLTLTQSHGAILTALNALFVTFVGLSPRKVPVAYLIICRDLFLAYRVFRYTPTFFFAVSRRWLLSSKASIASKHSERNHWPHQNYSNLLDLEKARSTCLSSYVPAFGIYHSIHHNLRTCGHIFVTNIFSER